MVNADNAREIGIKILKDMNGQRISSYSFKRKEQAVNMTSKNSVKVGDEDVQIDPVLMFQRLASFASKFPDKLEEAFGYELCNYATSLFDSAIFLKQPQKSQFSDAIWAIANPSPISLPTDAHFVLDGGALIHRVPWERGSSLHMIIDKYIVYVQTKYGAPTIVF